MPRLKLLRKILYARYKGRLLREVQKEALTRLTNGKPTHDTKGNLRKVQKEIYAW